MMIRTRSIVACRVAFLGPALALFLPACSWACACGCGVFDVGANTAFPNQADNGLSVWLRVSGMDQDRNWIGSSSAPAALNADKRIRSVFYDIGAQYMVNHSWGVMFDLPYVARSFTTVGDGGPYPAGSIATTKIAALGDLVIQGVYAGFSADMSTGLTFGLKLPTGDYTGPYVGPNGLPPSDPRSTTGGMAYDRDTLPGTGSTDLVLGGYHFAALSGDARWSYFAQARVQVALQTRDGATGSAAGAGYRPGNETILGAGLAWIAGEKDSYRVTPVMQVSWAVRGSDSGAASSPNSGYRRLLVGPGIDLRSGPWRVFADVELPAWQSVRTDVPGASSVGQLVARALWKFQLSHDF